MSEKIIDNINQPSDIKKLSLGSLKTLANEVRDFIIDAVKKQGGHLASNLGTVELTLALHYVFSTPKDKILWDVGHQAYTHKILTGRKEGFKLLRENDGVSGFPNIKESEHDAFTVGHSSTSLSLALGFARARKILDEDYNIISVIGDGAFTGGMAFEALNDIGASKAKVIIVLNDNEMSISQNVGALSNYFARLRLSKRYSRFKLNIKKGVSSLPFFGNVLVSGLDKVKDGFKTAFMTNKMFEQMGIKYFGPFDGHDTHHLIDVLKNLKNQKGPVLLHLVTNKGNGLYEAEKNPSKFHGFTPVKPDDYSKSFSDQMGKSLTRLADENKNIVAVTAAMCDGTGLTEFSNKHKERYFDVGIAEQHAVTLCAGMAKQGLKPYFAVYSSFLQRAYDQLIHDVCLNNLPVTLLIDRAGIIGADGVTHQGVFDLSYLSSMPNMTVLCPKDDKELDMMLEWSVGFNAPIAIRYPKGFVTDFTVHEKIETGKWEILRKIKSNNYLLCAGNRMLDIVSDIKSGNVINARFIKPLDIIMLKSINKTGNKIITLEDNILKGGFGENVLSYLNSEGLNAKVVNLGLADSFIENLNIANVLNQNGLCKENIEKLLE